MRSVSSWSCGFLEPDTVEQSIHEAYIDTITRSQHYIYIENQFFISLPYNNPNTRNQVAEALYTRIIRAHKYVQMVLQIGFATYYYLNYRVNDHVNVNKFEMFM